MVYVHLEKYDLALRDGLKAVELDPQLLSAYVNLGLVYERMRRFDLAVETYSEALMHHPLSAELFNYRSQAYVKLNYAKPALVDALKAKELGWPGLDHYIKQLVDYVVAP